MGDKTAARRAAIACNVPIVPGTNQALENVEEAKAFAEEVRGSSSSSVCNSSSSNRSSSIGSSISSSGSSRRGAVWWCGRHST